MITKGMLYIISAPSGTGKSALIQALLETYLFCNTKISISYTTRNKRPGEVDGQHYFFVSLTEFKRMISDNSLLEYAQVFNHYYGTVRDTIYKSLSTGIDMFLDIDWQGAQQIRHKIPTSRSIFILPPSKEELSRRLRRRGQDSNDIVSQRMSQAISEITHFVEYDYLIINDDFNTALFDLKTIIQAERLHLRRQQLYHSMLIKDLLFN